VKDANTRLACDLALAVIRLARQLRYRRPDNHVSFTELSALTTLAREGAMTPGALAEHEQVRPPSMTRVIASLVERGLVERTPHPDDGRQILVSLADAGSELLESEHRATNEWLLGRLEDMTPAQRATLAEAAELICALVEENV